MFAQHCIKSKQRLSINIATSRQMMPLPQHKIACDVIALPSELCLCQNLYSKHSKPLRFWHRPHSHVSLFALPFELEEFWAVGACRPGLQRETMQTTDEPHAPNITMVSLKYSIRKFLNKFRLTYAATWFVSSQRNHFETIMVSTFSPTNISNLLSTRGNKYN